MESVDSKLLNGNFNTAHSWPEVIISLMLRVGPGVQNVHHHTAPASLKSGLAHFRMC